MVRKLPATQQTQVRPLSREDPLVRDSLPTSVFLPGEPMDRGICKAKATAQVVTKSQTWLSH